MKQPALFIMAITMALALTQTSRVGADTGGWPDVGNMTISLGPTKAFAFNTAIVASPRGLSGRIELYGIGADGGRTLLCTSSVGWASTVDMRFYADADLRALSAEGHSADGQIMRSTARALPGLAASLADEAAIMLAAPVFPSWERGTGVAPASAMVGAETADDMAAFAMSRLFMPWRNRAPLLVLALWSAIVIAMPLIAGKWRQKPAGRRAACVVASALVVSLLVAVTALPRPRIYSIGTPAPGVLALGIPAPEASGTGAPPVRYLPNAASGRGWTDILWDAAEAGTAGLRFILADAAGTAGVPLDSLGPYHRIRFKAAPLIVMLEDGSVVLAPRMMMAWGIHE